MKRTPLKALLISVWILTIVGIAVAAGVGSIAAWIVVAGVALLPPLVMLKKWTDPERTMSERIRAAQQ